MVEVIKESKVPTAEITCNNCKSVLRYGNKDLDVMYRTDTFNVTYLKKEYFTFRCPVCGVRVEANWIINNEDVNLKSN